VKTSELYKRPGGTGCYRSKSEADRDCDMLNDEANEIEFPWRVYETIPGVIWNIVRFPQFRNRVDK
jgi:hypothetical protein